MNYFNVVAGCASILSLIIGIIAFRKANKVEKIVNTHLDKSSTKSKININGNNNKTAGRDIND